MSPSVAIAPTIKPPAPRPWMARKAISSAMVCDRPDNADPARKMMMAAMKNFFRPYMSPSLP